ncbi:MAG TPA: hypothetical protein P5568_08590 [Acidobacteriota bacterium]|nr:hypothetical protein [Acidobacteriota bacterium]
MDLQSAIGLVANCNDRSVLHDNLLASPDLIAGQIPIEIEYEPPAAGIGLNRAISRVRTRVVVCAHQDVYLPKGWLRRLVQTIESLESRQKSWGVIGVVGVTLSGKLAGRSYSVGLAREVGTKITRPCPVVSLDELVLVVNRDSPARLDPNLPGFHLYGSDLAQKNVSLGWAALAIDNPLIHNSIRVVSLGVDYARAYRYMVEKWRDRLPIPTTVLPIAASPWPLFRWRLTTVLARLHGRAQVNARHPSPGQLAAELGYSET